MMTINEIKKDLYKSKAIAKLSHYNGDTGELIYTVDINGVPHQFPLHVVEKTVVVKEFSERLNQDKTSIKVEIPTIKLADDLRGANFGAEVKGSDLIRWITKAVEKNELIRLAA